MDHNKKKTNRKKKNFALWIVSAICLCVSIGLILLSLGIGSGDEGQEELPEKTIGEAIVLFGSGSIRDVLLCENNEMRITLDDESEYLVHLRSEGEFTEYFADIISEQLTSGILSSFNIEKLPLTQSSLLLVFINLGSTVIMLGMIGFILYKTLNVAPKAQTQKAEGRGTTFDDVAGMQEEKESLMEIVDFLKNPDRYEKMGASIPHGVLMEGDPGTGKTLLARAVAGEAGVPFYTVNGSDFVEVFSGVGPMRMRKLFREARKSGSAIIFIDEIDGVGKQRTQYNGNGEEDRTLNQLLTEMDGFEANTGIVVIGATNRVSDLDKALLRPGRFDRKIHVSNPDVDERMAILELHAKNKPLSDDVDLYRIARETTGLSGADLANILNEAAIAAVRDRHDEICQQDIMNAMLCLSTGTEKKSRIISQDDRIRTAYHEAGHAVISYHLYKQSVLSSKVSKISIVPRGKSGGFTSYVPDTDKLYYTDKELRAQIIALLAGRASEQLFLESTSSGSSDDLSKATEIAAAMTSKFGMSKYYGLSVHNNVTAENSTFIREAVDNELNHANNDAEAMVLNCKKQIRRVSSYLLEHETMTDDVLADIIGNAQTEDNTASVFGNGENIPALQKKSPSSSAVLVEV